MKTLTGAETVVGRVWAHSSKRHGIMGRWCLHAWHVPPRPETRWLIVRLAAHTGEVSSSHILLVVGRNGHGLSPRIADLQAYDGFREVRQIWWDDRRDDLAHLGLHCQSFLLGTIALLNQGAEGLHSHWHCWQSLSQALGERKALGEAFTF